MSADRALDALRARKWRIGVAESCTGGGLGAALTAISGSSDVFWGGVIAYSNDVKTALLKVNPKTIEKYGAVSEEVAREMAKGCASLLDVEVAISISGVAGPGAEGSKPEGRVCFALQTPDHIPNYMIAETVEFGALGRENVRQGAIRHALAMIASQAAKK